MQEEKKVVEKAKPEEKKPIKKPTTVKESDFKRRYFEFYDDVKISDRQDW